MDCITISDDSSHTSSRDAPIVFNSNQKRQTSVTSIPITVDSESTQRCPVTWNSDKKRKRTAITQYTNNNVTPMVNNRVKMWLASTMQLQQTAATCSPINNETFEQSDSRSNSSPVDEYFIRNSCREELQTRSILIKRNYARDEAILSSICTYQPEWKCNNEQTLNGHYNKKDSESESSRETNYCSVHNSEDVDDSDEGNGKSEQKCNNNEVPLSPDTQKKNELCSYLQLMNMNCTDHKMASKIQNRRSTRVRNLIIMSEKKELEKKLNIKGKRKETSFNGDIEENQRTLQSKSFSELNMNVNGWDVRDNFDTTQPSRKLLNVHDIPLKILTKCSDFDETIADFIETEGYGFENEIEVEGNSKRAVKGKKLVTKKYSKKAKYPNRNFKTLPDSKMLSKSKFKLKQSPRLYRKKLRTAPPKPEESPPLKKDTPSLKKETPSSRRERQSLRKRAQSSKKDMLSLKKETPSPKKKFMVRSETYRRIFLRHNGRDNLRSSLSLSNVGIKTLILNDNNIKKRHVKVKSAKNSPKVILRNQKKVSKPHAMIKPTGNFNPVVQINEIFPKEKRNDAYLDDDIEIISLANSFSLRSKPMIESIEDPYKKPLVGKKTKPSQIKDTGTSNEAVKTKKKPIIEDTQEIIPNIDFTNGYTENVQVEKNQSKSPVSDDDTNNFNGKTFSIIDLSHSKLSNSIDTLIDHDYTLKPLPSKAYIINTVVGSSDEKAPVTKPVESKSVSDNSYCLSPDDINTCKEQEYCRETLEEIIGIPWRYVSKKDSKDKEDEANSKLSPSKSTENQLPPSLPQYEYSSYQDSLVNKPTSPNKMFNIHLPLLEPPTNIFDEESCCSSRLEQLDEPHRTIAKDEVIAKPQIITMAVPPEVKSLHKSLMQSKRKPQLRNSELLGESSNHTWDNDSSCEDKRSHLIKISSNSGKVLNAFYVDFNLAIVQKQSVQFWCQSALGNMLGSQDLWISKGSLQRLVFDSTCVFKETSDMVMSLENSFAYIELWTKEHKSDKRERPLADVFATVYFWRHRQNGPSRKFLQLENING